MPVKYKIAYFQFRKYLQIKICQIGFTFCLLALLSGFLNQHAHHLTFENPPLTLSVAQTTDSALPLTVATESPKSNAVGVEEKLLKAVCSIESHCDSSRVGDGGKSYGAFQIYLPAHPTITKEQAMDYEWAKSWTLEHCKQYVNDPATFFKCHNGIAKTTNQWYVDKAMEIYSQL